MDDPNAMKFFNHLMQSIVRNREEIDRYIAKHTFNWDMSRIAIIDKNILRMALAEILYCEDIPPKVSINEAIEIAKKFSSTDKSSKFVNGILDAIFNDMKAEGRIKSADEAWSTTPNRKCRKRKTTGNQLFQQR